MYRSRRITDGSLKLNDTARISRSYTEMTSTLPWHHSVMAFCQWTILRGSYDALRRSVCSMESGMRRSNCARGLSRCQDDETVNTLTSMVRGNWQPPLQMTREQPQTMGL